MSETEPQATVGDPVGARLKAAREAQGMSLDDVAAKTRVPIRHLLHMEQGEWAELPATTYSVGFARAYATAVGLNAAEVGADLRAQLGAPQAIATPSYYEPADGSRVPPRSLAIVAAVIAVLLLAGYLYWRNKAVGAGMDEAEIAAVSVPPLPAAPTAPAPQGPSIAVQGPVVLTATDDVWLRVYEAGGKKLFENTLKKGDTFQVPADAKQPQILTGRPNAVQVTVGGKAIPPLGSPERTIADVSLLPADLLARPPAPATASPAPPRG